MLVITHTRIEPTGLYNQWDCYAVSSDSRYYTELGWPSFKGSGIHHVVVHARNASSAKRKIDRLIRKVEKKYNY